MKRIIRTGFLQVVLAMNLVMPGFMFAQQPVASSSPSRHEQMDQMHHQLIQQGEMIRILTKLVGEMKLDKATREKLEAERQKKIKDAKELMKEPADFGSEKGAAIRKELQEIVSELPDIDAATTKQDVEKFVNKIQEGQYKARQARNEAFAAYQDSIAKTPPNFQRILEDRVDVEKLKTLGKDELQKVLRKLNPGLSDEDIKKFETAADLAEEIYGYSKNGSWSPELIASVGDAFEQITGEQLPPEVKTSAEDVTDTFRAVADFATTSITVMEAAISTGNPYVIAAAAVILALIALFKFVLGGGGGGDGGDGDGEGKGSKGRNQGAGDPSNYPGQQGGNPPGKGKDQSGQGSVAGTDDPAKKSANKPGKPGRGDVPLPNDPNAPLVRFIKDGVLHVERRADSKELFQVDLRQLRYAGSSSELVNLDIASISDVTKIHDQAPFGVTIRVGSKSHVVVHRDNQWLVLRGKPLPPIKGKNGSGLYDFTIDGSVMRAYKGSTLEFELKASEVNKRQGKDLVPFGFRPSKLKSVVAIGPGKLFFVNYEKTSGKTELLKVYVGEEGKWIIETPIQ